MRHSSVSLAAHTVSSLQNTNKFCFYFLFVQDDGVVERARINKLESANHQLQNEVARLSNSAQHTEKLVYTRMPICCSRNVPIPAGHTETMTEIAKERKHLLYHAGFLSFCFVAQMIYLGNFFLPVK